ncbi:hypothetical protein PC9H_004836 [Pleurotus ostreatus]|uniref:non-specific serine/threonine protein kinase n=1 Tax=Pleurotus ostreatus TaxID=5322 RepID=A0A8H7DTS1_PLEOS|nr:uncharacterized protein PC9H_004836 [Pleurotus ostreatus]KAF7432892.1 hypothetical protein PC9H_004836 [Pleurotus ostreatus]KAJ8698530.1 hypothetical protein PTI98_005233 [Pleurotus ostreatus]
MLGARTKQVVSYGRRNQRIVPTDDKDRKHASIFDDLPPPQWAPVVSKMRKREEPPVKPASPKFVVMKRKKRLSPILSPPNVKKRARAAQLRFEECAPKEPSPAKKLIHASPATKKATLRAPLSPYPINLINSPVKPAKSTRKSMAHTALGKPLALTSPAPPCVDINITVLDKEGKTVSKERRVSGSNAAVIPLGTKANTRPKEDTSSQRRSRAQKPRPAPERSPPVMSWLVSDSEADSPAQKSKPAPRPTLPVVSWLASDSEADSPITVPKTRTRRVKVARIISEDEASSSSSNEVVPFDDGIPEFHDPPPVDASRRDSNHPTETVLPFRPYGTKFTTPSSPPSRSLPSYNPSPILKPRPLTPIRKKHGFRFHEPPSPPSPCELSDFDLSAEFASLDIGDGTDPSMQTEPPRPEYPEYLMPLLRECQQENTGPYEFSAFIEAFPMDPVVRTKTSEVKFKKIGEASFSEVFGIGDVVLKIIPLRDERAVLSEGADDVDGPPPSDANDVLKEMIVTRAMGSVSEGFVELLKTYIVRGRYPELLLDLWDEYLEQNGSESVRPDTFMVSQVYAIIVLPNGGPDLEAYTFTTPTKTGWRQASSVFWQVAKTLSHAEQLVSFEHRDLHWGQILVKNTCTAPYALPLGTRNQNQKHVGPKMKMDDQQHGVKVTLIDLGLSRMDAGDGAGGELVHWTPFDEEVFMGEGDYQFDIYRLMREHNGDAWEDFRPLTNVMWLHYLVLKLMRSKKLRPPPTRKDKDNKRLSVAPSPQTEFTERDCYEIMVGVEKYLGKSVASVVASSKKSKTKARRKTQAPASAPELLGPSCAGELLEYGVKHGWVDPIR